ncbi:Neisseria PilC beta-propeller domain [Solimonas aquatica]|uniref:Neisseria PilC beta-propeller domain n=1 Tax=Solimonas aquatica TaxID=489703 RepID=A0A1H9FSJ0_9GAMM|nr:hypothetical protein [Solimonas aquatica]SEQ40483.1 Neisseria PilC beta-propeller domain [Solimonas aquatica]
MRRLPLAALLALLLSRSGDDSRAQSLPACPLDGGEIVAQTRIGGDLALLASYRLLQRDAHQHEARWTGELRALFVDARGWLREDGDGDGQLGDYTQDPAVALRYEAGEVASRFDRYQRDPQLGLFDSLPLSALRPLWRAGAWLSAVPDARLQRDYASAQRARHLFTALDLDQDGRFSADEQLPLQPASFSAGRYGLLDLPDAGSATQLIEHVRGAAVPELRARELLEDGVLRTQRLGMILNSQPLLIGAPAEHYDLLYADTSYSAFFKRYRQRRRVVYLGAGDGLLHAFNAGFAGSAPDGLSAHAPGAELWAYAPYNLLPHLRELGSDSAPQQAWVDAAPTAFDLRIFNEDADHPGGWGTLLVVGMRLRAAPRTLPRNAAPAAFAGFAGSEPLRTRPALLLLDVSNPEQPPRLLAELSDAALGFTLAQPAAFRVGGKWFLLFGSGPDDARRASASSSARLYVYDLAAARYVSGYAPRDLGSLAPASFIGSAVAVDWNLDFNTDSLYFGTASGEAATPGGRLLRLDLHDSPEPSAWTLHSVLEARRPLLEKPAPRLDAQQRRWLYLGSGRLLSDSDGSSRAAQAALGVIDDGSTLLDAEQLYNSSAASLDGRDTVSGISGIRSLAQLRSAVAARGGWRVDLPVESSAERASAAPLLADGSLLLATAIPTAAGSCLAAQRRLYALEPDSGALRLRTGADAAGALRSATALGAGPPLKPALLLAGGKTPAPPLRILPGAGAVLNAPQADHGAPAGSGEIDWWELHP